MAVAEGWIGRMVTMTMNCVAVGVADGSGS
jgi:hypothetical protein